MARDMTPVLKKCRSLGIEPAVLGYDKVSHRNTQRMGKTVDRLRAALFHLRLTVADIVHGGVRNLARLGEPVNTHIPLLQSVLYRHGLSPAFTIYYNGQPL